MIALIAIAVLATSSATWADQPQDSSAPILNLVPEAAVHQAVEAYVLESVAGKVDADARVTVNTRWQGGVVLDRAGQVDFRINPLSSRPFRGPVVVRVELVVAGETARALTMTVDTRIHRPVLVTTMAARRGTPVTAEITDLVERDITSLKSGFYTDLSELDGWQLRRPVGFGDVLTSRHVEPVPVIARGDDIVLIAETANMQLSVRGVAMQDGGIGSRIRVKNADSGKILSGRVIDAGTVRIGS